MKKILAICRRISELTTADRCWLDKEEQVGLLNHMLVGWADYFGQSPVTAYRRVTNPAFVLWQSRGTRFSDKRE